MTTVAYPERFDIGRVVTRGFGIISRNLAALAILTLMLYGIPKLGASMVDVMTDAMPMVKPLFWGTEFIYGLAAAVGYIVLQSAVVYVGAADLNGRVPSLRRALRTGLQFWAPVLVGFLLTLIGVVLGMVMLIVPGLFLATIWAVSIPSIVVERLRGVDGMSRSAWLTEGYRWPVFALGGLFMLTFWLIHGMVGGVQSGFLWATHLNGAHDAVKDITRDIFEILSALIGSVLVFSTYFELRQVKEDAGPEIFADLLD